MLFFRLKKIFWILFILFDFCILAAVIGGVYFLESDNPRLELESLLSEKLGRKVVFQENLDLIFYPWLGVDTGPITVDSAPGAEYPHQLTVKDIDFKVRLLPLLSGDLEVDKIIVDSPVFRMDRKKDGKLDLPAIKDNGESEKSDPDSKIFKSISVSGVNVVNATYTYKDIASGNSFKMSGINIRTGLLRKNTPLAFDISAMLSTDIFGIKAQADVKGLMDFSRRERTVSLSETSLSVTVKSEEVLGPKDSIQGIANLDFNLVEGLIDVKGLVVQGAGLRLSGDAICKNMYDSPDFRGKLKSTRFDPKAVFSRFTPVPIPKEFKDILNSASFAVDFHSTLYKTELSNMVLAVDKTKLKGDFLLKDYKKPWIEFDVFADSIDLDPYIKLFELRKKMASNDKRTFDQNGTSSSSASKGTGFNIREMVIADLVRKLPCKGKLEIGKLTYDGLRLDKTSLAISPGPKIANLSIGRGSYLDGDFSLMADLAFSNKKAKDVLYLKGKGNVSPFSLKNIPAKLDGIKFRSGKAGLSLRLLTSQGKTPVELVRNLKLALNVEGKDVGVDLSHKDIPAEYRNIRAKSLKFGLSASPVRGHAPNGLVGRNIKVDIMSDISKPEVKLEGKFSGEVFCSRIEPNALVLKKSKLDFSVGGEGVPVIKREVSLSVSGGGDLQKRNIKLDSFSLKSGKIDLKADVDAKRIGSETASAMGKVQLGNTKGADIFALFGIDKPATQDENAFESLELDSTFQLNGENLNLRVNKCRLDNATAQGTFELVNFKNPSLNFVIEGDHVDVDRFLPPDEDDKKDNDSSKSKVKNSAEEFEIKLPEWQFPDKLLSSINATGKVTCRYFRIFDFGGSKISADVDMQNSVIGIHNLNAKFHEGKLAGKLDLGLRNGTVSLDSDFEARNFKAGLFFEDYTGHDYVKGPTDASLKLKGYSSSNIDFSNTMAGKLVFKITNGSYLFTGSTEKKPKKGKALKPTHFSIMKGSIDGQDGTFKVNDYLLKTDYLTAVAKGGFSFPKDSINLKVDADIIKLPNLYLKIVNALLGALTGVNVTVTGQLSDPKVEVKGLERWSDVLGDVLGLPEQSFMFFRDLIF